MKFIPALFLLLLLAGCGTGEFKIVAVSGTVTMDGKPLAGAEVVFAPMEVENQVKVGPVSIAKTNADGKFELKTVKGQPGAVVGRHRVAVSFGEIDEAAIAAIVDEAISKNRGMSEAQMIAIEKKARQSLTSQKTIPEMYNKNTTLQFEVQSSTDSANFDLVSEEEK